MGNGFSATFLCCTRPPEAAVPRRFSVEPRPSDDDDHLGHSFSYLIPSPSRQSPAASAPRHHSHSPSFAVRSFSGAAVGANSISASALRPRAPDPDSSPSAASPVAFNPAGFEGSSSFAAGPLLVSSITVPGRPDHGLFLSGPIDRGIISDPMDGGSGGDGDVAFSGPLGNKNRRQKRRGRGSSRFWGSDSAVLTGAPFFLRRNPSERRSHRPWIVPLRGYLPRRVQWARGKAGEDRIHVVVSEEHRWLFVGIYDGFNGQDAPEFLSAHLYRAIFDHLRGIFWEDEEEDDDDNDDYGLPKSPMRKIASVEEEEELGGNRDERGAENPRLRKQLWEFLAAGTDGRTPTALSSVSDRFALPMSRSSHCTRQREGRGIRFSDWRYSGERNEELRAPATRHGRRKRWKTGTFADHGLVLGALSRALEMTEAAYLETTDRAISRRPELAMTGSCLLVVLMREDDVYVMNVGDSRALIAQSKSPAAETREGERTGKCGHGLVSTDDIEEAARRSSGTPAMELVALQLSSDHSTSIDEEVHRIKEEHPDDSKCIVKDRVKGRLKVTRAFGAAFLKQPRWNNGLLEIFRNDYIGEKPYISCSPSLCHHKIAKDDQFLVLSSDGLYQYLTNEEVVSHVQNFMERFPEGDPAQSLIEESLLRAANQAGMDFFELLDIPQGARRKYHDDVTVMVVSLVGRTWMSTGKC